MAEVGQVDMKVILREMQKNLDTSMELCDNDIEAWSYNLGASHGISVAMAVLGAQINLKPTPR